MGASKLAGNLARVLYPFFLTMQYLILNQDLFPSGGAMLLNLSVDPASANMSLEQEDEKM